MTLDLAKMAAALTSMHLSIIEMQIMLQNQLEEQINAQLPKKNKQNTPQKRFCQHSVKCIYHYL